MTEHNNMVKLIEENINYIIILICETESEIIQSRPR